MTSTVHLAGLSDDVERLTYRDLQARRETIRKRLEGRNLQ